MGHDPPPPSFQIANFSLLGIITAHSPAHQQITSSSSFAAIEGVGLLVQSASMGSCVTAPPVAVLLLLCPVLGYMLGYTRFGSDYFRGIEMYLMA
jgi:hypothetical protein